MPRLKSGNEIILKLAIEKEEKMRRFTTEEEEDTKKRRVWTTNGRQ